MNNRICPHCGAEAPADVPEPESCPSCERPWPKWRAEAGGRPKQPSPALDKTILERPADPEPAEDPGDAQPAEAEKPEPEKKARAIKDPLIGVQLGDCHVVERIGQGAMGAVYRGVQAQLDRHVAIKLIRPELFGDEKVLRRFYQEARTAGLFVSRNVVQVHRVGTHEGLHYIVMEYCPGGNLNAYVDGQPGRRLSTEDTVRWLRECCDCLAEAHEKNILHRDIKPANLLLDERGSIKLADFGLSKVIGSGIEDQLTATQDVVGTLLYMSPEQCEGKHLDFRSDMYALGATFFYLLTSELPATGGSFVELLRTKTSKQHLSPANELASDELGPLSRIIERMTKRDPEERYASYHEILEDLDELEETGNVTRAPVVKKRVRDRATKKKGGALKTVAILGLVAAAIAGGLYFGLDLPGLSKLEIEGNVAAHPQRPLGAASLSVSDPARPEEPAQRVAIGPEGQFRIELPKAQKEVKLRLDVRGYVPFERQLTLEGKDIRGFRFGLSPHCTLRYSLQREPADAEIGEVRVRLLRVESATAEQEAAMRRLESWPEDALAFEALRPGTYRIELTAEGYEELRSPELVLGREKLEDTVALTLRESEEPEPPIPGPPGKIPGTVPGGGTHSGPTEAEIAAIETSYRNWIKDHRMQLEKFGPSPSLVEQARSAFQNLGAVPDVPKLRDLRKTAAGVLDEVVAADQARQQMQREVTSHEALFPFDKLLTIHRQMDQYRQSAQRQGYTRLESWLDKQYAVYHEGQFAKAKAQYRDEIDSARALEGAPLMGKIRDLQRARENLDRVYSDREGAAAELDAVASLESLEEWRERIQNGIFVAQVLSKLPNDTYAPSSLRQYFQTRDRFAGALETLAKEAKARGVQENPLIVSRKQEIEQSAAIWEKRSERVREFLDLATARKFGQLDNAWTREPDTQLKSLAELDALRRASAALSEAHALASVDLDFSGSLNRVQRARTELETFGSLPKGWQPDALIAWTNEFTAKLTELQELASGSMAAVRGGPVHLRGQGEKKVGPFLIDCTEVSHREFLAFAKEHDDLQKLQKLAPHIPGGQAAVRRLQGDLKGYVRKHESLSGDELERPAQDVSYLEARAYAAAKGRELLTQDRWWLVARGPGPNTRSPLSQVKGGVHLGASIYARVSGGGFAPLERTGQKPVYHLLGNVAEWLHETKGRTGFLIGGWIHSRRNDRDLLGEVPRTADAAGNPPPGAGLRTTLPIGTALENFAPR